MRNKLSRILAGAILAPVVMFMAAGCSEQQAGKPAAETAVAAPAAEKTADALFAGTGMAKNEDAKAAGAEAAAQAMKAMGQAKADVVIVYPNYKSSDYETLKQKTAAAFEGAREAADGSLVVGCAATAGFLGSQGYGDENSVGAIAIKAEGGIRIQTEKVAYDMGDLDKTGQDLGRQLAADDNVAMILITDSNISHNEPQVSDFLAGLRKTVGKGVIIAGGNSMGFDDFHSPVFYADTLDEKVAVGIMFSGNLKAGVGIANNFEFVNEAPMKITKSEGRAIFTLDDKPVADVVAELTGVDKEGQKDVNAALANIFAYKINDKPFILFQRALKEDDRGIYYDGFPNFMPQGREVYIAKFVKEKIVPSSAESVKNSLAMLGDVKPAVALPFVCCGRAGVGQQQAGENQAIIETASANVPMLGFYACGEFNTINPGKEDEQTKYCQFSSIILLLGVK